MDPTDFPVPQPAPIAGFSPSLANQLLACALRAAFARDPAHRRWRKPSTYTALGVVAHAVTEAAFSRAHIPENEGIRAHLEQRWEVEAVRAAADLNREWAPAMPPPPSEWPGYALTRARTIRRATKIMATRSPEPRRSAEGTGIEIELRDASSGLFGRADRIERDGTSTRVVDLKTGLTQDTPTLDQRRQLLLYAVLVHRASGAWPRTIAIEDASGARHSSELDVNEAERALQEVKDAIAGFNGVVETPERFLERAEPSADKCRWCAYRVICAPYWSSLAADWAHRASLGTVTVSGDAADGHYVCLTIESPAEQAGERLHIRGLSEEVSAHATMVAVVDWVGTPGESDLRARWSTTLRSW